MDRRFAVSRTREGLCEACPREDVLEFLMRNKIAYTDVFAGVHRDVYNYAKWSAFYSSGQIHSLMALFHQIHPPSLFAVGNLTGLRCMYQERGLPDKVRISTTAEFVKSMSMDYHIVEYNMMQQMYLFKKKTGRCRGSVTRLGPVDMDDIQVLFDDAQLGDFLDVYQLVNGIYFGMWEGHRLVCMCGTHVFNTECGMASIGNVITHPEYRGRSYATQCLHSLIREISRTCSHICIKATVQNDAAIQLYKKVGFIKCQEFFEGIIQKKT